MTACAMHVPLRAARRSQWNRRRSRWREDAMTVSGVGGYQAYTATGAAAKTGASKKTDDATGLSDTEQRFMTEMRKTPAQRLREQWLKAHNLTEDDLASKTPEERKAIEDSITEEIKKRLSNKQDQRGALVDMAA
jgi:hypothetical protein